MLQDCELSFEEGDLLFVTDRSDPDWFLAIADKKKGYIPSNHGEHSNQLNSLPFLINVL